MITVKKFISDT